MRRRKGNYFQILSNGTAAIYLTQGKIALVDWSDLSNILRWTWFAMLSRGLWRAATTGKPQSRKNILMHRLLLNAPDGTQVDHVNSDGLDNCKANIRLATPWENQYNRRKQHKTSSVYKGVCWNKSQQQWGAYIAQRGKQMFLGYYDIEADAARAYNEAAQRYFGEFARLNEIEKGA